MNENVRLTSNMDNNHYETLSNGDPEKVSSGKLGKLSAFSTLFKAIVGTGILALPSAMKQCGLVLGVFLIGAMCIFSLYTMTAIIKTIWRLRERGVAADRDGKIEYSDINFLAFGRFGTALSSFCLITCQVGSVIGYLVFISSNICAVFEIEDAWKPLCLCAPVLMGLALLRDTVILSKTAIMGNLALFLGIFAIYWAGGHDKDAFTDYKTLDVTGLSTMFGVALFMFSAHAEIVSIEQSMEKPREFLKVLNWGFVFIVVLYLQFGVLVYLFFGERTGMKVVDKHGHEVYVEGTIFDNIGTGYFANSVKLLMSVCLLFQYPITLLPASICIEQLLGLVTSMGDSDSGALDQDLLGEVDLYSDYPKAYDDKELSVNSNIEVGARLEPARRQASYDAKRNILRICLVGFTAFIASGEVSFEFITSFTGCFSNGLLAFILPPLFYAKVCGDTMSPSAHLFNKFVLVVGVVGCGYSSIDILYQLLA